MVILGRLSKHFIQLLGRHTAFFQRLLETARLFNTFLAQQALIHQRFLQKVCVVVSGFTKAFRSKQLVKAGVKGLLQPVVPPGCTACEHVPELFRQIAPESLCFLVVAKQDIKGLHPAAAHSVLRGVHRFAETLCLLCRLKGLHGHFIVLIRNCFNGQRCLTVVLVRVRVQFCLDGFCKLGILPEGLFHNLPVCPLFLQAVVKAAGGHSTFLDLTHFYAGVDQQLLQLLGSDACLLHALPVDQLDGTGAVALRQIIDDPLELRSALARVSRGVCHAHDHRDHLFDATARAGQGGKSTRHVRKAVAGLIREPHQLFQIPVHLRNALTRRVHDGLYAGSLLGILVPAARHLIEGKAFHQLLTGVHGLPRNMTQGRNAHHFHRRKLSAQVVQRALHLVKVHFGRCIADLFKTLFRAVQP